MRKIILFGAGLNGGAAYRFWGSENIIAYVDNNPGLVGTIYNNKPVIGIDEFVARYKNEQVVITSYRGRFQVAKQLEELGISDYYIAPHMFHNFWRNVNEIIRAYSLEECKKVYIYGANPFSELLADSLNSLGISAIFISEGKGVGDEYHGNVVIPLDSVENDATVLIMEQNVELNPFHGKTFKVFNVFDRLNQYKRKDDIARFQGIHTGKRAFIIGNGPSLLGSDLDKIYVKGDISFGCNGIYKFFDKTKWRPTYYVSVDLESWNKWKEQIIRYVDPVSESFIFYWNDEPMRMMKNVHMFSIKDSDEFNFTEDFSLYAYSMMGVAGYMLQLAIYMGITEIYLLGMDLGNLGNHFYGKSGKMASDKSYIDFTTNRWRRQYEALNSWSKTHNIQIFNATRGGALETFERVSIDELF